MSIENIKSHIERKTEIFYLLSQLTDAPEINNEKFKKFLSKLNNNHQIFVYIKDDNIVGMITILIETKLIHNGSSVAHIEDLVVDKNYQKLGIAKKLIDFSVNYINNSINKCYKIILDCKKELIPFYNKFEFEERNIQMAKYL
tara:strand:+ start:286 stop:714 length:429 start_codon:yes stop_codon:yes gene_type:complete